MWSSKRQLLSTTTTSYKLSYCVARLKADSVRPVICHISFLVHSDAVIVQQEAKVIWEQAVLTLPCGHVNRLLKY